MMLSFFDVSIVLYPIKILSGSRNYFYFVYCNSKYELMTKQVIFPLHFLDADSILKCKSKFVNDLIYLFVTYL